MRTSDFEYELPPELVAQEPLPERTQARMLVVHRASGTLEHRRVADLPGYLRAGDIVVVNDTRVIPARIFGRWTDTQGKMELLLLEEREPGIWEALLRSRRRAVAGLVCILGRGTLAGTVVQAGPGGRVHLRLEGPAPVLEVLEAEGLPPVPPYISRKGPAAPLVRTDRERYQTVFARAPGAVAAPTAGLHFSNELLARLEGAGIRRTAVTLHVGPGTFKPVAVEELAEHVMEAERYCVTAEAARQIADARRGGGRVVAIGTTTVRTLESAAGPDGNIQPGEGRTSLFIRPPHAFRAVEALLTNFHLPRSTLLMLVSAFAGVDLIRQAYREAVRERYRFYSYGDSMLVV